MRSGSILILELPVTDIGKVSGNRSRSRHHGTDEMCSSPTSLSSLEIAVAGRGATLFRLQNVRIHTQAHRATRLTPFEACGAKDPVESLSLRCGLDHL